MIPAGRRVAAVALLLAALASALPTQSEGGGGGGDGQQQQQGGRDQDGPPECVSGHRRPNADGCGGDCFCLGGRWVCPEADCGKGNFLLKLHSNEEPLPLRRSKRVPLNGERCAPGVTYMDDCNTCICSQDGIKAHASCTFKPCTK